MQRLAFYVLAPPSQITKEAFSEHLDPAEIKPLSLKRVVLYGGLKDEWYAQWLSAHAASHRGLPHWPGKTLLPAWPSTTRRRRGDWRLLPVVLEIQCLTQRNLAFCAFCCLLSAAFRAFGAAWSQV